MTSKSQIFWDLVALVPLCCLIAVIIWIHITSPILTSTGPLDDSFVTQMSVGVAVAATIFTTFVTERVRHAFIRSLELELCSITAATDSDGVERRLKKLERTWRAVLRIDVFGERWTNVKSIWIFLRYMAVGLLTASIVTTFSPRAATRYIAYDLQIASAGYPVFAGPLVPPAETECADMFGPNITASGIHATGASWYMNNGSRFFGVYRGKEWCPAITALTLVDGINSASPEQYAYVDVASGIAVHQSAMGASRNIFTNPNLSRMQSQYGSSLLSTTQCVPVMKSNPIRCDRDPALRLEVVDDTHLRLLGILANTSQDYVVQYNRSLTFDNVMLNAVSPIQEDAYLTTEYIGQAAVVFSGYNGYPYDNATLSHAHDLARIMGDSNPEEGFAPNSSYIVSCWINPQPVFEHRLVTLQFNRPPSKHADTTTITNDTDTNTGLTYTRSLVGTEKCAPATENTVGFPQFVAAALPLWRLTNENAKVDGYFSTVNSIAWTQRGGKLPITPPFAFPNSRNALEDALGVVAALGVSTIQVTESNGVVPQALSVEGRGNVTGMDAMPSAAISVSGFSSTPLILVLVLIPPVFTFLVLAHLFWCSFRVAWTPGAGLLNKDKDQEDGTFRYGDEKEGSKKNSDQMFIAESARALMALGWQVLPPPARAPHAPGTTQRVSSITTPNEKPKLEVSVSQVNSQVNSSSSSNCGSPDSVSSPKTGDLTLTTTQRSTTF
ncbi:hypothetical protein B0H63DRAFT_434140 [Podospora didyma]|uniref:Uncharacterized protein n=1 Tax=Podospora didyma TaxID=330526 RepID=A0AAE0NG08_9PEZI|nr:hypothetical protein B0H63DRAFT_434140 [Podospora didyma]